MTENTSLSGFIAIVGRPNVGKSTLLNHLIGQKVSITSRKAQTTRHRIHGILTEGAAQFVFVDTPGFQTQHTNALNRGMNRVVTASLRDVHAVLFVIEARHFDERDRQVLELLPQDKPVILVINKADLMKDKSELLPFIEQVSVLRKFDAIVPVSARKDRQLDTLLGAIRPYLAEGEHLYAEDDITDRNERFLAAELLREKVFRFTGEELPYSVSVVIEQFRQEGKLRR
ncbi:MAG: GTPase Era, partial [Gallionellaceae bacterium CG_4_10_14_3_um_filter_60_1069]